MGFPTEINTGRVEHSVLVTCAHSQWCLTVNMVPLKSAGVLTGKSTIMQLHVSNEQIEGSAVSCRMLWLQANFPFSDTNFKARQEFQEAIAHEEVV